MTPYLLVAGYNKIISNRQHILFSTISWDMKEG